MVLTYAARFGSEHTRNREKIQYFGGKSGSKIGEHAICEHQDASEIAVP
jgi:hypothetical protein